MGYAQAAGAVVGCSSAYGRYSSEPLRAHGRFVDARVDYNIYIYTPSPQHTIYMCVSLNAQFFFFQLQYRRHIDPLLLHMMRFRQLQQLGVRAYKQITLHVFIQICLFTPTTLYFSSPESEDIRAVLIMFIYEPHTW